MKELELEYIDFDPLKYDMGQRLKEKHIDRQNIPFFVPN
jgi:hypothetical protein